MAVFHTGGIYCDSIPPLQQQQHYWHFYLLCTTYITGISIYPYCVADPSIAGCGDLPSLPSTGMGSTDTLSYPHDTSPCPAGSWENLRKTEVRID